VAGGGFETTGGVAGATVCGTGCIFNSSIFFRKASRALATASESGGGGGATEDAAGGWATVPGEGVARGTGAAAVLPAGG